VRQMGRTAMDALLYIFDGPHFTRNRRLDWQLIVGRSTTRPREDR